MTDKERAMVDEWLKHNKPTTENTEMRIKRETQKARRKIEGMEVEELMRILGCTQNYAYRLLNGVEPLSYKSVVKILEVMK